jgi:signal peptidase II
MEREIKKRHLAGLAVALLAVDQIVKIYIKTHMTLGQSIDVLGSWFRIAFVENEGAAWGMSLGGEHGKLILSLVRVAAAVAIAYGIGYLVRRRAPRGIVVGVTLIFAGAVGNIIDSAFYGLIFSESTPAAVATLLPEGGGYAGFLHGKVVDMLHFPLFTLQDPPAWLGWLSGADGRFTFFAPVFNLADSYISVAVIYLILFQRKYLS